MADTMVASHVKNPGNDMNSRKNKKPLMEKRRRARINSCLTQLKSLVLQAIKKDSSQFSKLEKADILELTVKHLRALQRQQAAGVMTSDPNVASKYRAGFNECAKEVVRYISTVREVNEDIKDRVLGHLANCLQVVNHVTVAESMQHHQQQQQQQITMKPLHVHIPSQQTLSAGAPSVIMHPQVAAASLSHPVASGLTAFAAPSPVSVRSSPPAQDLSPVYTSVSATQLSSLPMQSGTSSPGHLSGAFKIVPSSCGGGAVALYLGHAGGLHRDNIVSVNALPLYSVALPAPSSHGEVPVAAYAHPASSRLTSHAMTSHHMMDTSSSHYTMDTSSHHMMDTSYASSSSPSSVSSSPRLTPPMKSEYSPLHSSSVPVDLRQSHKVKASYMDHTQQPVNFGHCGSAALTDEKLWRPW